MKLQIDTAAKTIKVEGTVNLLELTETLERLLPNGVWKTFSLESNTTIVWTTPAVIYPVWPYYPWWQPPYVITCGAGTGVPVGQSSTVPNQFVYDLTTDEGCGTYALAQGTYNIEI